MSLKKRPKARGHREAHFTGLVGFKVKRDEWDKIRELADKHAHGTISIWVRAAALNYIPGGTKSEVKTKSRH